MNIGIIEELEDTKLKIKELYISIKEDVIDLGIRTVEKKGIKYYFLYIRDKESNTHIIAESDNYAIIKSILYRLLELNQLSDVKVVYIKYKKDIIIKTDDFIVDSVFGI